MKFINPSVEYWKQPQGLDGIWTQIARATRVCYQSKPREGETDKEFVERVILKPALIDGNLNDLEHCKFDFNKMHGAMLEHGTIYCKYNKGDISIDSPYIKTCLNKDHQICLTTNMRYIVENHKWWLLKYFYSSKPTEYHLKRYTFDVITDIGITREMNRHRTFSIAEQSTRYCDFNKDKFGGELTFITPNWSDNIPEYESMCSRIEDFYKQLRCMGWKPEQARQVLPLGLKTQAVYTAFEDDWQHFLALRADNASGRVHPNMWQIADMIRHEMIKEQII